MSAAERRLAYQETMANLAEQQWTAAKSFNDHLNLEKLTAVKNLQEAKIQAYGRKKWKNIAEMRETLLQLRIALHINKNKHRVLDRKARETKLHAEKLQKKLNSSVGNVNRSRQRVTDLITETDNRHNQSHRNARSSQKESLPVVHNNYSVSRGALTTAGSSMAGLSPPSSPMNKPVTKRESALHNLAPTPLYYTNDMIDEDGSIIRPSIDRKSKYPLDKPKSPWANRPASTDLLHSPVNEREQNQSQMGLLSDFHAQPYRTDPARKPNRKKFYKSMHLTP